MRSKLFRSIIVENMDQLLTLSVGFRRSMPLPAPPAIASCLRSKAMEFLEKWNSSYGVHYRQLRLGYDYLKNTLRLQFPNLQANAARIEQERREREMRSREILMNKFDALRANIPSIKEEVESMIHEIERCLDIIRTEEEGFVPLGPFEDEDFDEFRSRELLQIRLASLKEGEKLQENKDNKVVFDALRELYRLLVMKHLASVQESITVVVRVDVLDTRVRDSTLKELINIQNDILSVKKKCNEGVSVLSNNNKGVEEEEEDFWEEGKFETNEEEEEEEEGREEEISGEPSQSSIPMKDKLHESSNAGETAAGDKKKSANPLKDKLLAEAPVVTWGSNLEIWGGSRGSEVLANQRGLDVESHWGRVDYDAVIPAEKIAELNLQATLYKEERVVDIQPCLAPLLVSSSSKGGRGGGLCQRRDLKVCPFHGPIVPRDSEGIPINGNGSGAACSSIVETGNCKNLPENDIVKKLAEEAVKNVRRRDRDEAERRIEDKKIMKRAKLAKIRAHNEIVLRDAALASTSKSAAVGEEMEEETAGKLSSSSRKRTNKQSLASMLKKKVTVKDRIQQRLLHSQPATDVTRAIRLESDGDRQYREAFPNQW